jgi:putative ABC transport system permease protein
MNAVTLPARKLAKHRLRSILTAAGIGVAIASLLALVGLSRGIDRGAVLAMEDRGTNIVALKKGSVGVLTSVLDQSLADRLRAEPGVVNVMGSLGEIVELDNGEMAYMAGWARESEFWRTLHLTAGSLPGTSDQDSVVLGQALAEALGKRTGDQIELSGQSFRITGITRQASFIDDRSVMIPLRAMQKLLGRDGKVTGFHIRIDHPENPSRLAAVRDQLNAALPELTFILSSEMARENHLAGMLRALAWGSSTVALVMAFVGVLNTLLMAITERMREIGLLSAIGWTPARVIGMIVLEGLLLAAGGAALGVPMGFLGLQLMTQHAQMGAFLQPEITVALILQASAAALLVGALGGLYPAWRAMRMSPMELLRGE